MESEAITEIDAKIVQKQAEINDLQRIIESDLIHYLVALKLLLPERIKTVARAVFDSNPAVIMRMDDASIAAMKAEINELAFNSSIQVDALATKDVWPHIRHTHGYLPRALDFPALLP